MQTDIFWTSQSLPDEEVMGAYQVEFGETPPRRLRALVFLFDDEPNVLTWNMRLAVQAKQPLDFHAFEVKFLRTIPFTLRVYLWKCVPSPSRLWRRLEWILHGWNLTQPVAGLMGKVTVAFGWRILRQRLRSCPHYRTVQTPQDWRNLWYAMMTE